MLEAAHRQQHKASAIIYEELPGKEHWWWDTAAPNDGGVVNDPQLRRFYQTALAQSSFNAKLRQVLSGNDTAAAPLSPEDWHCSATVTDISQFHSRCGWSILQWTQPFTAASLSVSWRPGSAAEPKTAAEAAIDALGGTAPQAIGASVFLSVSTVNVRRLRFGREFNASALAAAAPALLGNGSGAVPQVAIDGQEFSFAAVITNDVCTAGGRWQLCGDGGTAASRLEGEWQFEMKERGPHTAGPIRQVRQKAAVQGVSVSSYLHLYLLLSFSFSGECGEVCHCHWHQKPFCPATV